MQLATVVFLSITIRLLCAAILPASADDLEPLRVDLERTLPEQALERFFAAPALVFRGVPPRASAVYRERVNGVVLIASTKTVGTGVVVSEHGDIITTEHIVRDAHKARGEEWVAVWFKPPDGVRPVKSNFLLAKVLQRSERRDLAHIQLAQLMPQSATVVPLAGALPNVGQDVFTIGHPKAYLWSFGQGVVSQIRPDYEWRYQDGIPRSATAIQTQAPINPGDSGGPLLNDEGAVVGIVVGSATETEGVSFAVAVQHLREVLPR
jgi:S1-C subfamily serine protease